MMGKPRPKPHQVIPCGECHKVAAQEEEDGSVVIWQRHGNEWHKTVLPVVLKERQ